MMAKFRKLPIVVDAVQWFPDDIHGGFQPGWRYHNFKVGTDAHGVEYTVCDVGLRTPEGFIHITPGDWIITGIKGERYLCKPHIFAATHEQVAS